MVLLLVCFSANADELGIGPLVPIEVPSLTTNWWRPPSYPGVAVSGTNAVLYWGQWGGELPGATSATPVGLTNLFLSHLDTEARPIDDPGRFVMPLPASRYGARFIPADAGFFVLFSGAVGFGYPAPTNVFFTRINAGGEPMFEPILLSTNQAAYQVVGNGQTMLFAQSTRTNGILFKLIDRNGATVSRGAIADSVRMYQSTPLFTLATDGRDYLLAWPSPSGGFLQLSRFSGDTGAYTTLSSTNNATNIHAMGHGKNGYLLLFEGGRVRQLREDGSQIAMANLSMTTYRSAIVYGEGDGWVVFVWTGETVYSYRVTPNAVQGASSLAIERNPYPPFSVFPSTFLENSVVPFGPGRYLIGRNGASILTKSAITPVLRPRSFLAQMFSALTASPVGFLIAWTERDKANVLLRGLRLARDGSKIDDRSFVIASIPQTAANEPPSCEFDGNDYAVSWPDIYPAPRHLARISPSGAPNIRMQSLGVSNVNSLTLLAHQGQLLAYHSDFNSAVPDMHIWPVSQTGEVGPETLVHGQTLVNDGPDLVSVGVNEQFEVYRMTVQPGAANPEISTNIIGQGSSARAYDLRDGFVVRWADPAGAYPYAYFSNGQEKLRVTPPSSGFPYFAGMDDRVLVMTAIRQSTKHGYDVQLFNVRTGETASQQVSLGTINRINIAAAAKDFLAITDSASPEREYIGELWISPTAPPAFAQPQISATGVTARLTLNPERRYRIETSTDLVNWTLQQIVTGTSAFDVTAPPSTQLFVRAILIPE